MDVVERYAKPRCKPMSSTLVSRNVTVNGRRTSVRLEPKMWEALREISDVTGVSVDEFCSQVESEHNSSSLTAGIRVAILGFYRSAARLAKSDRPPRWPEVA